MSYKRKEVIGACTLYLGDCLEVMQGLGKVDHILMDPPYEKFM
ncbi:MAG: site-specific DNA-methyltransferase, partial [Ketobacter sp.]|nr:site-specific DNA-methyltransferase [Ketobacter sp.]